MNIESKLPNVGTTIFAVMSGLAAKHQAINLSQGFPDFMCSERLIELVNHFMKAGKNQYAPMPGDPALREAIATKIQLLYNKTVSADHEITITAGGTQAIFTAIAALVHPGDEVIIIEPAYDCYKPTIELFGGICVPYALIGPDFEVNWQELEALVTPRTKMLMVNNPHNPCGTTFDAADMAALKKIVLDHDLILLSDEVYEHLVYDGRAHLSVLADDELRDRSIAIYSFGKTFHNTGWKMGYAVANPIITKEFRKVHQFNVFSVNTPMQSAYAAFMENPEEYLSLPAFYQEKRDLFQALMQHSPLKALPSRGSYFQLYDYSAISQLDDRAFCEYLVEKHGVAAIPLSAFYTKPPDQHYIRLCFAKKAETLAAAAARLVKL